MPAANKPSAGPGVSRSGKTINIGWANIRRLLAAIALGFSMLPSNAMGKRHTGTHVDLSYVIGIGPTGEVTATVTAASLTGITANIGTGLAGATMAIGAVKLREPRSPLFSNEHADA